MSKRNNSDVAKVNMNVKVARKTPVVRSLIAPRLRANIARPTLVRRTVVPSSVVVLPTEDNLPTVSSDMVEESKLENFESELESDNDESDDSDYVESEVDQHELEDKIRDTRSHYSKTFEGIMANKRVSDSLPFSFAQDFWHNGLAVPIKPGIFGPRAPEADQGFGGGISGLSRAFDNMVN